MAICLLPEPGRAGSQQEAGMCTAREALANGDSRAWPLLPRQQKPGMKSEPGMQGQDS